MTASSIIRETAAAHGVTEALALSKRRTTKLFLVRMTIAVRLRKELGYTHAQIGAALNRSVNTADYYLYETVRKNKRRRCSTYMQARRAA